MCRTIDRKVFDNVCTITFDQPKSSANVLNEGIFEELNVQLDFIEGNEDTLRGVVFASAKKSIFIAGADLNAFASDPDEARVEEHLALCPLQIPPYIEENLTSEVIFVRPVLPIDR